MKSQFGWELPEWAGCKKCKEQGLETCACVCKHEPELKRDQIERWQTEQDRDERIGSRLAEGFRAWGQYE